MSAGHAGLGERLKNALSPETQETGGVPGSGTTPGGTLQGEGCEKRGMDAVGASTVTNVNTPRSRPPPLATSTATTATTTTHTTKKEADARNVLCGEEIYTTMVPSELIVEKKEWVREHHPVEKRYQVETKFVGEKLRYDLMEREVMDVKERVIADVTPKEPCE